MSQAIDTATQILGDPPWAGGSRIAAEGIDLALLGHDLRASLSEVHASLSHLASTEVTESTRQAMAQLLAAGEVLARLIDQSVLVCLGQGTPLLTAPGHLATQTLLKNLRHRWAGPGGNRLVLDVAKDLPPSLQIDQTALDRVLSNLISNALAHSGAEQVTVSLAVPVPGDSLLITVADTGPGYPPEALARLTSLGPPSDLPRQAKGLGLFSVKQLVAAMGGDLAALNRPEGGAMVRITLPVHILAPLQPPVLDGLRIMVVDDSATCRAIACQWLLDLGAAPTAVAQPAEVLATLDAIRPDVLILDQELSESNGVALLQHLRSHPGAGRDLVVLAVTGHGDDATHAALLAAGALRVLTKPLSGPTQLGQAVLAALAKARAPLHRLARLAGPAAAAELFLRLQEDLAQAQSGLKRAALTQDFKQIRAHSHVIIALSGTAGAMGLHDDAVRLNAMAHEPAPPSDLFALAMALDAGLDQLISATRQVAKTEGLPP